MDNPAFIIPEFLGFLVGMLVTFLTWVFYFAFSERPSHRRQIEILQANLLKTQRAWSKVEGRWVELSHYHPDTESKKQIRTRLLLLFLLPLLSWFGFVFSLILLLSFKFVPTRVERQIFSSKLTSQPDLSRAEVEEILGQISI